jgi:hypothetical protein
MKKILFIVMVVLAMTFSYSEAQMRLHGLQRGVPSGAGDPLRHPSTGGGVAAGADVTAPTVSTATIGTNGTTLTIGMSETVTRSGGTFDVDCTTAGNGITCTYSSGSGSNSMVYTLGTTVNSGDTCNLDYDGAANGIEDGAGNDLDAITNKDITNNSTQSAGQWYYSVGSDNYTNTGSYNADNRFGDLWTPGVNKTITKIGIKLGDSISATACTISLWENVESTWTRRACGSVASPTTGWNDYTLSSSFSLTSGMEIIIAANCNASVDILYAGSSGGYFEGSKTYANECSSATCNGNDDWQHAVRFWGE